jgi:hypothetical protein
LRAGSVPGGTFGGARFGVLRLGEGAEGLRVGGFGVGELGVGVEWVISPTVACRARWRSTSQIPLGGFCKDFLNKALNSKLTSSVVSSRFYPRETHAFKFLTAGLASVPFRFALVRVRVRVV